MDEKMITKLKKLGESEIRFDEFSLDVDLVLEAEGFRDPEEQFKRKAAMSGFRIIGTDLLMNAEIEDGAIIFVCKPKEETD